MQAVVTDRRFLLHYCGNPSLASRDDAMRWIINHQLGRRNLEPLQKDVLIGRRYELEKKLVGRPEEQFRQNAGITSEPTQTAERLAQEYQVDTRTVERAGEFVQGLDALATIREDLPEIILTQQSRREQTAS